MIGLRSVFTTALKKTLGKYVRDLNVDKLNLGVTGGNIVLENLEVEEDAVNAVLADLPFRCRRGFIGKLMIQVSWLSLLSSPIEIRIENLFLLFSPLFPGETDTESLWSIRRQNVAEDIEAAERRILQKLEQSAREAAAETGMLARLITRITENLVVHVRNVHARLEMDPVSLGYSSAPPFALGICLEGISMLSASPSWEVAECADPGEVLYKLLEVREASVYWDTHDAGFEVEVRRRREKHYGTAAVDTSRFERQLLATLMEASVYDSSHVTHRRHEYVVQPVSTVVRVQFCKKIPRDEQMTRLSMSISIDELRVAMSDAQYQDMQRLLSLMVQQSRQQQYSDIRPSEDVCSNPRAWWRFAVEAIVKNVSHLETMSIDKVLRRHRESIEYINLFRKMLRYERRALAGSAFSAAEKRRFDELECVRFSISDAVLFRRFARKLESPSEKSAVLTSLWEDAKSETSESQSWGSWLRSWTPWAASQPEDSDLASSPQQSRSSRAASASSKEASAARHMSGTPLKLNMMGKSIELSEEERNALMKEALDDVASGHVAPGGPKSGDTSRNRSDGASAAEVEDAMSFEVVLSLAQGSFELRSGSGLHASDVLVLAYRSFNVIAVSNAKEFGLSVSIASLVARDGLVRQSVYPVILAPVSMFANGAGERGGDDFREESNASLATVGRSSSSANSSSAVASAGECSDVFALTIEQQRGADRETAVSMRIQPVYLVVNTRVLARAAACFTEVPDAQMETLEELVHAELGVVARLGSEAIADAVQARGALIVNLSIGAPRVIIPEDASRGYGAVLAIDFGMLSVSTATSEYSTAEISDKIRDGEELSDEMLYDRFSFRAADFRIRCVEDVMNDASCDLHECWRLIEAHALADNGANDEIVGRFELRGTLERAVVSAPGRAALRVGVVIPALDVHYSPVKDALLMRLLAAAALPFAEVAQQRENRGNGSAHQLGSSPHAKSVQPDSGEELASDDADSGATSDSGAESVDGREGGGDAVEIDLAIHSLNLALDCVDAEGLDEAPLVELEVVGIVVAAHTAPGSLEATGALECAAVHDRRRVAPSTPRPGARRGRESAVHAPPVLSCAWGREAPRPFLAFSARTVAPDGGVEAEVDVRSVEVDVDAHAVAAVLETLGRLGADRNARWEDDEEGDALADDFLTHSAQTHSLDGAATGAGAGAGADDVRKGLIPSHDVASDRRALRAVESVSMQRGSSSTQGGGLRQLQRGSSQHLRQSVSAIIAAAAARGALTSGGGGDAAPGEHTPGGVPAHFHIAEHRRKMSLSAGGGSANLATMIAQLRAASSQSSIPAPANAKDEKEGGFVRAIMHPSEGVQTSGRQEPNADHSALDANQHRTGNPAAGKDAIGSAHAGGIIGSDAQSTVSSSSASTSTGAAVPLRLRVMAEGFGVALRIGEARIASARIAEIHATLRTTPEGDSRVLCSVRDVCVEDATVTSRALGSTDITRVLGAARRSGAAAFEIAAASFSPTTTARLGYGSSLSVSGDDVGVVLRMGFVADVNAFLATALPAGSSGASSTGATDDVPSARAAATAEPLAAPSRLSVELRGISIIMPVSLTDERCIRCELDTVRVNNDALVFPCPGSLSSFGSGTAAHGDMCQSLLNASTLALAGDAASGATSDDDFFSASEDEEDGGAAGAGAGDDEVDDDDDDDEDALFSASSGSDGDEDDVAFSYRANATEWDNNDRFQATCVEVLSLRMWSTFAELARAPAESCGSPLASLHLHVYVQQVETDCGVAAATGMTETDAADVADFRFAASVARVLVIAPLPIRLQVEQSSVAALQALAAGNLSDSGTVASSVGPASFGSGDGPSSSVQAGEHGPGNQRDEALAPLVQTVVRFATPDVTVGFATLATPEGKVLDAPNDESMAEAASGYGDGVGARTPAAADQSRERLLGTVRLGAPRVTLCTGPDGNFAALRVGALGVHCANVAGFERGATGTSHEGRGLGAPLLQCTGDDGIDLAASVFLPTASPGAPGQSAVIVARLSNPRIVVDVEAFSQLAGVFAGPPSGCDAGGERSMGESEGEPGRVAVVKDLGSGFHPGATSGKPPTRGSREESPRAAGGGTRTAPGPPESTIELRVAIPGLQLVAPAAVPVGGAVSLSLDIEAEYAAASSGRQIAVAKLRQVEAAACAGAALGADARALLWPFTVSVEFKAGMTGGELDLPDGSSAILLEVDTINGELTGRDVRLLTSVAERMSAEVAALSPVDSTDGSARLVPVEPASDGTSASNAAPHSESYASAVVHEIDLRILDDTAVMLLPVLRVVSSDISVLALTSTISSASLRSADGQGTPQGGDGGSPGSLCARTDVEAALTLRVEYYNRTVMAYEPAIEPWSCRMELRQVTPLVSHSAGERRANTGVAAAPLVPAKDLQSTSASATPAGANAARAGGREEGTGSVVVQSEMSVALTGVDLLNVNVTPSLCRNVSRLVDIFAENGTADSRVAPSAPFSIRNMTGGDVVVAADEFRSERIPHGDVRAIVIDDDEVLTSRSLVLGDTEAERSADKLVRISVGCNEGPCASVPVQLGTMAAFSLEGGDAGHSGPPPVLVVDAEVRGDARTLTLRSSIVVDNDTCGDVQIMAYTSGSDEKFSARLAPGSSVPLPLRLAADALLLVRPAGTSHAWSPEVRVGSLGTPGAAVVCLAAAVHGDGSVADGVLPPLASPMTTAGLSKPDPGVGRWRWWPARRSQSGNGPVHPDERAPERSAAAQPADTGRSVVDGDKYAPSTVGKPGQGRGAHANTSSAARDGGAPSLSRSGSVRRSLALDTARSSSASASFRSRTSAASTASRRSYAMALGVHANEMRVFGQRCGARTPAQALHDASFPLSDSGSASASASASVSGATPSIPEGAAQAAGVPVRHARLRARNLRVSLRPLVRVRNIAPVTLHLSFGDEREREVEADVVVAGGESADVALAAAPAGRHVVVQVRREGWPWSRRARVSPKTRGVTLTDPLGQRIRLSLRIEELSGGALDITAYFAFVVYNVTGLNLKYAEVDVVGGRTRMRTQDARLDARTLSGVRELFLRQNELQRIPNMMFSTSQLLPLRARAAVRVADVKTTWTDAFSVESVGSVGHVHVREHHSMLDRFVNRHRLRRFDFGVQVQTPTGVGGDIGGTSSSIANTAAAAQCPRESGLGLVHEIVVAPRYVIVNASSCGLVVKDAYAPDSNSAGRAAAEVLAPHACVPMYWADHRHPGYVQIALADQDSQWSPPVRIEAVGTRFARVPLLGGEASSHDRGAPPHTSEGSPLYHGDEIVPSWQDASAFVSLTITLRGASLFVAVREVETTPYRVENHTGVPVFVQQRGVENAAAVGALPFDSAPFVWDDEDKKHEVVVSMRKGPFAAEAPPPARAGHSADARPDEETPDQVDEPRMSSSSGDYVDASIMFDRVGECKELEGSLAGPVRVLVVLDGATKVLVVAPLASAGIPELLPRSGATAARHADRSSTVASDESVPGTAVLSAAAQSAAAVAVDSMTRIVLALPRLGVSLVTARPRELLYITLSGIEISGAICSQKDTEIDLSVGDLQIDHQSYSAHFPVVLHAPPSERRLADDKADGQAGSPGSASRDLVETLPVFFAHVSLSNKRADVDRFERLVLVLQPLHVQLEEQLLYNIAEFATDVALAFGDNDATSEPDDMGAGRNADLDKARSPRQGKDVPNASSHKSRAAAEDGAASALESVLASVSAAGKSRLVYFRKLEIHPVKVWVSFAASALLRDDESGDSDEGDDDDAGGSEGEDRDHSAGEDRETVRDDGGARSDGGRVPRWRRAFARWKPDHRAGADPEPRASPSRSDTDLEDVTRFPEGSQAGSVGEGHSSRASQSSSASDRASGAGAFSEPLSAPSSSAGDGVARGTRRRDKGRRRSRRSRRRRRRRASNAASAGRVGGGSALTTGASLFVSRFVRSVGLTLASIDRAPIRLKSLSIDHVFETHAQLAERISQHYQMQVVFEVYKILGSADILGNPVNLVSSLGTGVTSLFYEPALAMRESASLSSVGRGIARGALSAVKHSLAGALNTASKLTGTVSGGLANLGFDDDYVRRRRVMLSRTRAAGGPTSGGANPRAAHADQGRRATGGSDRDRGLTHTLEATTSVGRSIGAGAMHLGRGILDGVAGVLTKPIEGAGRDGFGGFLKGIGKGIIGVAVKPVTSVLDFASHTTDSLRHYTETLDGSGGDDLTNVRRVRAPRLFGGSGNILVPYAETESEGQFLLYSIDGGQYARERVLAHLTVPPSSVLVTARRILCVKLRTLAQRWMVPVREIHAIEIEPESTSNDRKDVVHVVYEREEDKARKRAVHGKGRHHNLKRRSFALPPSGTAEGTRIRNAVSQIKALIAERRNGAVPLLVGAGAARRVQRGGSSVAEEDAAIGASLGGVGSAASVINDSASDISSVAGVEQRIPGDTARAADVGNVSQPSGDERAPERQTGAAAVAPGVRDLQRSVSFAGIDVGNESDGDDRDRSFKTSASEREGGEAGASVTGPGSASEASTSGTGPIGGKGRRRRAGRLFTPIEDTIVRKHK